MLNKNKLTYTLWSFIPITSDAGDDILLYLDLSSKFLKSSSKIITFEIGMKEYHFSIMRTQIPYSSKGTKANTEFIFDILSP